MRLMTNKFSELLRRNITYSKTSLSSPPSVHIIFGEVREVAKI